MSGNDVRLEDSAGLSPHATPLALFVGVLVLDVLTKLWVVNNFSLHQSVEVLGDVVRLTYTHNPGAAFGIHVGEHSRIFFLVLASVALVVLGWLYRSTPAWDRLRLIAIALVGAGALGNILDRLRYERGVVDFIDVGIGTSRWPVFNVADSAVTMGAILLLISFWLEGRHEEEAEGAEPPRSHGAEPVEGAEPESVGG